MGYIRHHAIVVTAFYYVRADEPGSEDERHYIEVAHEAAERFFAPTSVDITAPTPEAVNFTRSFLVAPDGSKEGWDASDEGNRARAKFISWLKGMQYGDGSSPFAWALIQYGDDDRDARLLLASDFEVAS